MSKDSIGKTIFVTVLLCVCCSILVSSAAVLLRPKQKENQSLDIKKNLLITAGLIENGKVSKEKIMEIYLSVDEKIVDLATGEYVEKNELKTSNQMKETKEISKDMDIAGIKRRELYGKVYLIREDGGKMIVLPIRGKGLWSTLYGFLVLDVDAVTVRGIGFYQHGETPGLGGEVDNVRWKNLWKGKKIYSASNKPAIKVIKGQVTSGMKGEKHKVDGLSGATITSVGVENLVNYWIGEDGYKKFLVRLKNEEKNEY